MLVAHFHFCDAAPSERADQKNHATFYDLRLEKYFQTSQIQGLRKQNFTLKRNMFF